MVSIFALLLKKLTFNIAPVSDSNMTFDTLAPFQSTSVPFSGQSVVGSKGSTVVVVVVVVAAVVYFSIQKFKFSL